MLSNFKFCLQKLAKHKFTSIWEIMIILKFCNESLRKVKTTGMGVQFLKVPANHVGWKKIKSKVNSIRTDKTQKSEWQEVAKFEINKQQKTRQTFRWGASTFWKKNVEVFLIVHFIPKKKKERKKITCKRGIIEKYLYRQCNLSGWYLSLPSTIWIVES